MCAPRIDSDSRRIQDTDQDRGQQRLERGDDAPRVPIPKARVHQRLEPCTQRVQWIPAVLIPVLNPQKGIPGASLSV